MMENGRPRLCHMSKSKRRDTNGIMEIVNDNRTKEPIVSSSPFIQKTKNVKEEEKIHSQLRFWVFRVRVGDFSLGFWAIRLSEFFGLRSKAVLCSEGFVWIPVLRSFDKLREVEV